MKAVANILLIVGLAMVIFDEFYIEKQKTSETLIGSISSAQKKQAGNLLQYTCIAITFIGLAGRWLSENKPSTAGK